MMLSSRALESSSDSVIAHWLSALLFKIATGVEDNAEVMDFVWSTHYKPIFEPVYELVCSPYQTPFTIYQILIFSLRFYSQTQLLSLSDFSATEATQEFSMTLRVFYLIALHATGDVELSDIQQLELSGINTLSEYKNVRQNLMNAVASPSTGTIQIGHTEWEDYLVVISRMTVLVPHANVDLDDMTTVIDVLCKYMWITSSKGNMPLSELSFPHHSPLPQLVFDESPSPVDTDLISFSPPSTSDFAPSESPRFFTAPSSPAEWNPSTDPVWGVWNPADDPIVASDRCRAKNIAPGSGAAVYILADSGASSSVSSFDSAQDVKLYQPRPKRAITLDLVKLEASVKPSPALFQKAGTESRLTDVSDWKDWIDWCRVQV